MDTAVLARGSVHSLEETMLVYLPGSPGLAKSVDEAMEAWQQFCALPEKIKQRFGYTPDERISGAGYELKRGENGSDLKEDFHVRRDRRKFLYDEARNVALREAREFLDAAFAIYDHLDPLTRQFAESLENELDMPDFYRSVRRRESSCIIRLLHYFGGCTPGDVLGRPHPDKGGFTGHLHESHPGVERLTMDGRWVPMNVEDGEHMLFAGLGLQGRSEGRIKAPWHRIVANDTTAKAGRWSAVCFSEVGGRVYDKKTHGSTQDLPLGLTYTQPFEEFNKLLMD